MIYKKRINSLSDLLEKYKDEQSPVLAHLCPDCESENFLIDEVIKKVQANCSTLYTYIKITKRTAQKLKDELMIIKSPVLILIYQGSIRAVYAGYIGYNQLCKAIEEYADKTAISN